MATIVIQPGPTVGIDTHLRELTPNNNYATDALTLYRTNTARRVSLIRFTIPNKVTGGIRSAYITFVFSAAPAAVNYTIRAAHPWVEAEATWNIYSTGNSWHGGSPEHASNRDNTYGVQGVLPAAPATVNTPEIVDLVRDAIANHSRVLDLILLPETGAAGQQWVFGSSDSAAASRPALTIDYGGGAPTGVFDTRVQRGPHPTIF